jgi:hypothetical protein
MPQMTELESYLNRLTAMRDRLRRAIGDEIDQAREAIRKPGETSNLHTHNADMDVEGLDPAVGVGHALQDRLEAVEEILGRLDREGERYLATDRERIDAYLDTEGFAERVRDGASGAQAAVDGPANTATSTDRSGQSKERGKRGRPAK